MTKGRYGRPLGIASRVASLAVFVSCAALPAVAQETSGIRNVTAIRPGSEAESYIRYLQSIGSAGLTGFAIREPSVVRSAQLFPTRPNPWSDRFTSDSASSSLIDVRIFPVDLLAVVNSHFPEGQNDGAVWAGRGLTMAATAGGTVRAGPVILQLNPVAFWSQNAEFELQNNGRTGDDRFASGKPAFANSVDLPQRFGDGAYSRVDLGDSELRVEFPWFKAGVSNAHRVWGPATVYPFLLGTNAPGFEHAFLSTNNPINLGFARADANILWGMLSQSAYSPVKGSETFYSLSEPGTKRYATGIAVSLQINGVPGLEIGAARFIQSLWPRSGLPSGYFTKVFQNFLKSSLSEGNAKDPSDLIGSDNQLLSGYVRWVLPHSGMDVYFEYGRDDHAYDFRDLVNEPDHSRSYMLGARKVLSTSDKYLSAIRAEAINFSLPGTARHRDEGGIYGHAVIRQGQTQRGQLLGAPVGVGAGSGSTVAYDRFTPTGSLSVAWKRTVSQEAGAFYFTGVTNPSSMDVSHSLSVEKVFFRGPIDVTTSGTATREFNRNFVTDAVNFSFSLGGRYNIR